MKQQKKSKRQKVNKMSQKYHLCYLVFLLMPILFLFSTSLKSQELGDLGGAVQDSMSDTISQVNDIDLGEAKSELAEGIDDAMGKMGEGMEFALQALEGGDAETALKTMEMLESTMDMAIGAIPKEIIFTSGATEANNLALQGAARFYKEKGERVFQIEIEGKDANIRNELLFGFSAMSQFANVSKTKFKQFVLIIHFENHVVPVVAKSDIACLKSFFIDQTIDELNWRKKCLNIKEM